MSSILVVAEPTTMWTMWTIYERPTDYPNDYVARRFVVKPKDPPFSEAVPTDTVLVNKLSMLRALFRHWGLVCFPAGPNDEPQIVETWL